MAATRDLGRAAHRLLWALLLLAAVLQVALPELREVSGLWLGRPWPSPAALAVGEAGRRLGRPPAEPRDAAAAMAAAIRASYQTRTAADAWSGLRAAQARMPGDEPLLIRSALRLRAFPLEDRPASEARAIREAATAATLGAPANAVGWYLLAACEVDDGHRAAALAAVARGNRCPRADEYDRELIQANARHRRSTGDSEMGCWMSAVNGHLFGQLSTYRRLARSLRESATPAERFEIAAMGARLRDGATQSIPALVGVAVEAIALADYQTRQTSQKDMTRMQRADLLCAGARRLADALRAAGRQAQADWLTGEARRFRAAKSGPASSLPEAVEHVPVYAGTASWVQAMLRGALILLAACVALALSRRERPSAGAAARARRAVPLLLTLAYVASTSVGCVAVGTCYMGDPDRLRGVGDALWWLGWAPLVVGLLAARLVGQAAARQSGLSDPRRTRALIRGCALSLLLPTAGLWLLLAWAGQAPVVGQRQAIIASLRQAAHDELGPMRAAMDAAAPARPLPR
ncbi:MAG: hypothetical protein HZB16_00125 [Armatimonadetes bacterium]|nr:hypothetical protein [Armatimonadota bacterium]